jgi:hypothetical protein
MPGRMKRKSSPCEWHWNGEKRTTPKSKASRGVCSGGKVIGFRVHRCTLLYPTLGVRPFLSCSVLIATTLNFEATLATQDHGLRYLGPTLRGAFGYVLKRTVCQVQHGQCHRCILREVCPYPMIFEGRPPESRRLLQKGTAVPQPFILRVAPPGEWDGTPDALRWGVTLFGDAIRWAPYVVEAFLRIGASGVGRRRVPFQLDRVIAHGNEPVWVRGQDRLSVPPPLVVNPVSSVQNGVVRFTFHTPVHLRKDGATAHDVQPIDLVLAGRRRYRMLRHFFAGESIESMPREERLESTDFELLSCSMRDWGINRLSGRQHRTVRLEGQFGDMVIRGPWNHAGDWLGVVDTIGLGKYVTFGFGRVTWRQEN